MCFYNYRKVEFVISILYTGSQSFIKIEIVYSPNACMNVVDILILITD